jgi:dephospho-CoA kinase
MTTIPVIGVTGGIACGKSSVTARMQEHGFSVIDADRVAREVVESGQPILKVIEQTFGQEIIKTDGTLDRKKLGSIVFSDPNQLQRLNSITHPAILKRVQAHIETHAAKGAKWVVYDAALIIENGLSPMLHKLVVVLCSPEIQLNRLMKRNQLTQLEAELRISKQTTNPIRREHADFVIENDGTLEELYRATETLISQIENTWA